MTRNDFKFAANFPTLTDEQIGSACDTVSVMFSGVLQCWRALGEPVRTQKRELCRRRPSRHRKRMSKREES